MKRRVNVVLLMGCLKQDYIKNGQQLKIDVIESQMNFINTMVGNEIGEVESINGFFYTVAFAERIEIIDIREVQYKVL